MILPLSKKKQEKKKHIKVYNTSKKSRCDQQSNLPKKQPTQSSHLLHSPQSHGVSIMTQARGTEKDGWMASWPDVGQLLHRVKV